MGAMDEAWRLNVCMEGGIWQIICEKKLRLYFAQWKLLVIFAPKYLRNFGANKCYYEQCGARKYKALRYEEY